MIEITPDFVFMNALVLLCTASGGLLIALSVHFIPVGGAPAAMAQATGVGTGTTQLAAGAGLTGLLAAGAVSAVTDDLFLSIMIGAVSSCLMIALTMFFANIVYVFGVGCPLVSGKTTKDPITKDRQDVYISKGTEGHGIPTTSFVSGLVGGLIGGLGGALIYNAILYACRHGSNMSFAASVALASIVSISLYYMNAVIASYNIGGTIEGIADKKFKKVPNALFTSFILTTISGIVCLLFVYLFIFPLSGGLFA